MHKFFLAICFIFILLYSNVQAKDFWQRVDTSYKGNVSTIGVDREGYIYLGSFNSGLLVSKDDGKTWEHLGFKNTYITSILIDQDNNLIVGTDYDGVFKSSDKGNTWIILNKGLRNLQIKDILMNSKGKIFVCTTTGVYYLDKNNIWLQNNNNLTNAFTNTIYINSKDEVFVGIIGGLFVSKDDTKTWKAINEGKLTIHLIEGDEKGNIFSDDGLDHINISDNQGKTWKLVNKKNKLYSFSSNYKSDAKGGFTLKSRIKNSEIFFDRLHSNTILKKEKNKYIPWKKLNLPSLKGDYDFLDNNNNEDNDYKNSYKDNKGNRFYIEKGNLYKISKNNKKSQITNEIYIRNLFITSKGNIIIVNYKDRNYSVIYLDNNGKKISSINLSSDYLRSTDNFIFNSKNELFFYNGEIFKFDKFYTGFYPFSKGIGNDESINQVVKDKSNNLYAGTNKGFYKLIESKGIWEEINSGLYNTNVRRITFDKKGYIYAITDGGIFRSYLPYNKIF
ncbi:MAG: hypothetical protein U0354_15965 [Candidatus Sericytochromatia bacterium]